MKIRSEQRAAGVNIHAALVCSTVLHMQEVFMVH